jgi:glycosyltransferase involved in cell wall biosynthesis
MTRGPRVALISFGPRDSTGWLARALAPHAAVELVVPDAMADYMRPDVGEGVRIFEFDWPRSSHPVAQVRRTVELVRLVRSLEPDVVHLQQGHHVFNLALGRLRGCPLVVTVHEATAPRHPRHQRRRVPQWAMNVAFRRADRIIVHGEALRAPVVRRGVEPSAIHVVPRAAPPYIHGAAGGERSPTVLFFGRIFPYKGLEYLIEAAPLVAAEVPDASFVIAGTGQGLTRYRRLMTDPDRFRVEDRFIPRGERDALFRAASVVVLPYIDAATSAVLPIAYLHRKPVVVTAVGGLPEAVEHGRTGLVVPPRDPAALAAALVRLLRDRRLRNDLGTAGRRVLETQNAPDRVARKTLEVYELARAPRRSPAQAALPERAYT